MKNEYKKQHTIMILCFLLGGFSIIMYAFQIYDNYLRAENIGAMNETFAPRENNLTQFNRYPERFAPLTPFTSPFSFMFLLNGIILISAGTALWSLTRDKEIKSAKEKITSLLLMPEERAVIDELKRAKGSITQSQLVKNTGLSKVKMHRVVNRLVAKGIIRKYPYGLTNKIVLEKEI
jgi:uncharacterized membrane protein